MIWCPWWVLHWPVWSSAGDRAPTARPMDPFHPDQKISAEPHGCKGKHTWKHLCVCVWFSFGRVCVSYSQYCSLGLCTDEGQVRFSWVQLATKTPVSLQDPGRVKTDTKKVSSIVAQQRRSFKITTVPLQEAPAGVVLQLPSAQLRQADHGRGNWKEANM